MTTFKQKLYCRLKVPTEYQNLETLIKDNIFLKSTQAKKSSLKQNQSLKVNDEIKLLMLQSYYQTKDVYSPFKPGTKYLECRT